MPEEALKMFSHIDATEIRPSRPASPHCTLTARVVITYVDSRTSQLRGNETSDVLTSSYLPIEEFYSEVDTLEAQLLEKVPYQDLHTVTVSHITNTGKEFETRRAEEM
jgi:hypothetical protein